MVVILAVIILCACRNNKIKVAGVTIKARNSVTPPFARDVLVDYFIYATAVQLEINS